MGMRHLNEMEAERDDQCYFHYIFDMEGLKFDPSYLNIATGSFGGPLTYCYIDIPA